MRELMTEQLRKALDEAQSAARAMNQDFVGAEHLALGLLAATEGEAAGALAARRCNTAKVIRRLRTGLPTGKEPPVVTGPLPMSPKAKGAIDAALTRADQTHSPKLATRLVLLSLLEEKGSDVAEAFRAEGIDLGLLERALAQPPAEREPEEMPGHFADRLLAAIAAKQAPICVGIDPIVPMLPEELLPGGAGGGGENGEAALDAIFAFVTRVLKVVAPLAPVVKFQSAYFEPFHSEGVEAYFSLIGEARELGLLTIGDVKRGDIGPTAAAYAAGHLAERNADESNDAVPPDAITVNPMLGLDTIEPFIQTAIEWHKGLFVLVRTSNPGSAALQDVKLSDGRTWSEMLADSLRPIAESPGTIGEQGYSAIGAVVGATQPGTMKGLRERLPRSIFLLPGYGAQGATAEMTRAAFRDGRGAIVSASRSILYAGREARYRDRFGTDWERCIEQAAIDMKADVSRVIGG